MAGDPFADQYGELAVPLGEHRVELVAVFASGCGDGERTQALFDPLAHAMDERVALVCADAERIGEVLSFEALADRQFEDQLVAFVEPAGCAPNELGEFDGLGSFGASVEFSFVSHIEPRCRSEVVVRKVDCNCALALLGSPVHLVAQNREEPGFQSLGVAQLLHLSGCDEDDVLQHIGGIVAIVEHRCGCVVQGVGEAIVDPGERGGIAGQVACNQLRIGSQRCHGACASSTFLAVQRRWGGKSCGSFTGISEFLCSTLFGAAFTN